MNPVFAYGTLRDAEYLRALFDREVERRPARLHGWCAVALESGYLTVVQAPGRDVEGDLIALDDAELRLADAWEDVEYERVALDVQAAGGSGARAFVYVRPARRSAPPPRGAAAVKPRAAVLAEIRRFREAYARAKSERA